MPISFFRYQAGRVEHNETRHDCLFIHYRHDAQTKSHCPHPNRKASRVNGCRTLTTWKASFNRATLHSWQNILRRSCDTTVKKNVAPFAVDLLYCMDAPDADQPSAWCRVSLRSTRPTDWILFPATILSIASANMWISFDSRNRTTLQPPKWWQC
jgi:hypothetical protein